MPFKHLGRWEPGTYLGEESQLIFRMKAQVRNLGEVEKNLLALHLFLLIRILEFHTKILAVCVIVPVHIKQYAEHTGGALAILK